MDGLTAALYNGLLVFDSNAPTPYLCAGFVGVEFGMITGPWGKCDCYPSDAENVGPVSIPSKLLQ